MPIEVNRVNKECPRCKNPTIFDTGKNYFCGKCLADIPKEKSPEKIVVSEFDIKAPSIGLNLLVEANEPEITDDTAKEVEST